jgi:hypothetical protein
MAEHQIRFEDGGAYERNMGTWSRLAGDVFLDWLAAPSGLAANSIPASPPSVLVKDQASMNCGSNAGTIEYPARPRISAPQIAAISASEGGAELAELTAHPFPSRANGVISPHNIAERQTARCGPVVYRLPFPRKGRCARISF